MVAAVHAGGDAFSSLTDLLNCNTGYAEVCLGFIHNRGQQAFHAAGEELIHQGDDAEHVFVIIEGHAEAYVDGHKVGDVQKDEIFGAMAVFTREKRSATVLASEPCTVMVIPKEQFLSLMQSNPRIAHSLIESMARRIDLLNKEVTQLRLPAA